MMAQVYASDQCLMQPEHSSIQLSKKGLECNQDSKIVWKTGISDKIKLYLYTDGPSGSGHFWSGIVGVSSKNGTTPVVGACFTTTTIGWRTLQHFNNAAIPWIDDVDADGKDEIIYWHSFPLINEATPAEFGLMAWVYEVTSNDILSLNMDLSREMAKRLAKSYRSGNNLKDHILVKLRLKAASSLEMFINKKCK